MKKFLTKYTFWILQFTGWGAFAGFSLWASKMMYGTKGISIIFIPMVLAGVISTSLLRWFFKRYVSLKNFEIWDLVNIVFSTIITSLLFGKIIYAFGFITGRIFRYFDFHKPIITERPPDPGNGKYIGYFIIFTGWVVFYFGIKLLIMLNNERIDRIHLKASIKQAQLNTLKGQVNPQFMFTSLTNIKGLMLEDVGKSRDMLTKLAEILRYALTKNNINAIDLVEELEIVDNYIDLSMIQLEDRLEFLKEIEPQLLTVSVPPMLVLQLIENSIKFGVYNTKKAGKVVLSIYDKEGILHIKVVNTGRLEQNTESKLAHKKLKQRLRLLFGDIATYSISEEEGNTKILVKIPIQ